MRKLLAISLVAACACGGSQSFQDQARDAMPDSTRVHMGVPSDSQQRASTNLTAQTQQDLVAGSSGWYKATVAFVVSINASTAWTVAWTNTQPTSCSETSCTWGALLGAAPPEAQEAAVLYYVDEMTQAEIAEELGRTLPTIRKRLREFLACARKALSESLPGIELPRGDEP